MRLAATALLLALALPALADSPTAADVSRWVARLSADEAAVRDEAQRNLEGLDIAWKPALKDALAAATDAETRTRLENVIARFSHPQWRTDLGAALAEAKRDGKPLLVVATAGAPDGFS